MPPPLERSRLLLPCLLAVASLALVGPWRREEVAAGVAAASVVAALGLACWDLGRRGTATAPPLAEAGPLLDRLDRIAAVLEARPAAPTPTTAIDGLATMAAAIAEGRWADAEAMLAEHPDHPRAARFAEELSAAREDAAADLRGKLEAAQAVNDPERVLELHGGLAPLLTAEALAEVEGAVVKWFLALIMRRLRGGTVGPDVADLAARVAERFPRSVEGASLRASLATLRRSAGLCPRCARPYRGIAEACPLCLASPATAGPPVEAAPPPPPRTAPPDADDEPEPAPDGDGRDYPMFLDDLT